MQIHPLEPLSALEVERAVELLKAVPSCTACTRIISDEQIECEQAVLQSPEFKSALKRHYGVTDTALVMVDIWSAGY